MPELPEVETVVRTLAQHVVGRRVERVRVRRADVVRGDSRTPAALLQGQRIVGLQRHGKQLALIGEGKKNAVSGSDISGGAVCVHLGMSGSLCVVAGDYDKSVSTEAPKPAPKTDHVHVEWIFDDGTRLRFRDPRRFGGLWVFKNERELRETRWRRLGPDALLIRSKQLHAGLSRTRRALKAALLDQHLVAGLGNIYVDELLYATKLHPRKLALETTHAEGQRLVRAMRRILGRAIDAGGSTLRDYVDATGRAGGYQTRFKAYGRGGEPCGRCGDTLDTLIVAGRTTAACPGCQVGAGLTSE